MVSGIFFYYSLILLFASSAPVSIVDLLCVLCVRRPGIPGVLSRIRLLD